MTDIAARLNAVEARLRRTQLLLGVTVLGAASLILMGQAAPKKPGPKVLQADKIVLTANEFADVTAHPATVTLEPTVDGQLRVTGTFDGSPSTGAVNINGHTGQIALGSVGIGATTLSARGLTVLGADGTASLEAGNHFIGLVVWPERPAEELMAAVKNHTDVPGEVRVGLANYDQPLVIVEDRAGYSAHLGVAALKDGRTGAETTTSAASLRLFDASGKSLFAVP